MEAAGGDGERGSGRCRGTSTAPDRPNPLRSPRKASQTAGRTDRQPCLPQREAGKGMAWAVPGRAQAPGADPAPLCIHGPCSWDRAVPWEPRGSPNEGGKGPSTARLCAVTPDKHHPPSTPLPPKGVISRAPRQRNCLSAIPGAQRWKPAAPGPHRPWTARCGARQSTLQHSASGRVVGWQHKWLLRAAPSFRLPQALLREEPPIQTAPSQAWSNIPAKVLLRDDSRLGRLWSLHPQSSTRGPAAG